MRIVGRDVFSALSSLGLIGRWGGRPRRKPTPEDLVRHPTRRRILEHLSQRPGESASALGRTTGTRWGTLQYHLALLAQAGHVKSLPVGRERLYFPKGTKAPDAIRVALLRRRRLLALAQAVVATPGLAQQDLYARTSLPRKTLRVYANLLQSEGLLVEKVDGKYRRYYPTPRLKTLLKEGLGRQAPP